MRPTRFLDITGFHRHYLEDLDILYNVVYNNLVNRGVVILNNGDFYRDFIKYMYKYSFKYKSNYEP